MMLDYQTNETFKILEKERFEPEILIDPVDRGEGRSTSITAREVVWFTLWLMPAPEALSECVVVTLLSPKQMMKQFFL